jgi:hypothetical protein
MVNTLKHARRQGRAQGKALRGTQRTLLPVVRLRPLETLGVGAAANARGYTKLTACCRTSF